MNPHAKETSDGWGRLRTTLVVSGIRLAHSAVAVDTVRCSGRRRVGSVLREWGETTDHDGRTQRTSRVNYGHQRTVVQSRQPAGPIWGSRGREFKSRQPDKVRSRVKAALTCGNTTEGHSRSTTQEGALSLRPLTRALTNGAAGTTPRCHHLPGGSILIGASDHPRFTVPASL